MSSEDIEKLDLPISIADGETILRAIVAPSHLDKKGRVRAAAFRPPPGKSSISVMRQICGDDFCKAKGIEIGKASLEGYRGLLAIKAVSIRQAGSTVTDSRDEWLGHADLDHGFVSERDEPATSEMFKKMTERCQALKSLSCYFADPGPEGKGWKGPPLKLD